MIHKYVLPMLLDKFGKDMQLLMAIEEMSELTKELCKYKRYGDNKNHIIEEIADVQLLIYQLMLIFNCEDEVNKTIDAKCNRAIERYGFDINTMSY